MLHIGGTKVGTQKKHFMLRDGKYYDSVIYEILKELVNNQSLITIAGV